MRVLIIQPWIDYRGAETTCVYLAYHLNEIGHKATIASLFVDKDNLPSLANEVEISVLPGIFFTLCRKSRLFLFLFGTPLLFFNVLLAKEVDVLNPHNLPAYWIAVVVGKIRGLPVVWTAHTIPAPLPLKECRDLIDYFTWMIGSSCIDRFFVKRVNKIIVSGEFLQQMIWKQYEKEAKIIPLGINLENFKLANPLSVRKKYGLADCNILLNVATLRADKNQDFILKVLKKVQVVYPNTVLIICGSGPEEQRLKEVAGRLSIKQSVIFAGFVEPTDLAVYYAAADLYLLPSRLETWGLTVFEALSQKTVPVVSFSVGAAQTIRKNNLGLVIEEDTNKWSEAIINSLGINRRRIRKMGEAGYRFVARQFSWRKYAEETAKILKEKN